MRNCRFEGSRSNAVAGTERGCVFAISGVTSGGCCPTPYGSGSIQAALRNNIFSNIAGTACDFTTGSRGGASSARLWNNVFVKCETAIANVSPYDNSVKNNILLQNETAVRRTGSQSSDVSYNCFFENTTNFSGYKPESYGNVLLSNRHGNPCDLLFNLFQDPMLADTPKMQMQPGSPCIDAGAPGLDQIDICFDANGQASQGSELNDLGVYGGSDAGNWLPTVPRLPASLSMRVDGDDIYMEWPVIPGARHEILRTRNFETIAWSSFGTNSFTDRVARMKVGSRADAPTDFFKVISLGE